MTEEEWNLVSSCIKHDQRAAKQFYDRFSAPMFGLCLRYCDRREDAQDVLHDGFLKIFQNLHSLSPDSALAPWVRTVILRTAISFWRVRSQRDATSLNDLDDTCQPVTVDYDRYDTDRIVQAIRQLPHNYRLVFNLHEVEGYSYPELSSQLGLAESTVRSLCFRAKARLAAALADLKE